MKSLKTFGRHVVWSYLNPCLTHFLRKPFVFCIECDHRKSHASNVHCTHRFLFVQWRTWLFVHDAPINVFKLSRTKQSAINLLVSNHWTLLMSNQFKNRFESEWWWWWWCVYVGGGVLPLTSARYVTVGNLYQAQTSYCGNDRRPFLNKVYQNSINLSFRTRMIQPIDYTMLLTQYLHFLPFKIDFLYFYQYFNAGGPQPKQYFTVKIWKSI